MRMKQAQVMTMYGHTEECVEVIQLDKQKKRGDSLDEVLQLAVLKSEQTFV